jgi:hypothetical protein
MSTRSLKQLLGGTVLGAILLTAPACAEPRGRIYVTAAPPRPIVEVRRVAPGPAYVWVDGYHRWDGRAYRWVPGRWEAKPRARATWVKGKWVKGRKGYYFVDGHWR